MKHACFALLCGSLSIAACGEEPLRLRGTLDLAALGRTGGALIAVRDDGAISGRELSSGGAFEIELEREHAFAFGFEDRGRHFADLLFRDGEAEKSVVRAG